MRWMGYLLWLMAGAALAVFFLLMQRWTVNRIQPNQVKRSKRLVIGGAILRWFLFTLISLLALQHALSSMFIVFIAFMTTLLILVFSTTQVSLAKPGRNHLN